MKKILQGNAIRNIGLVVTTIGNNPKVIDFKLTCIPKLFLVNCGEYEFYIEKVDLLNLLEFAKKNFREEVRKEFQQHMQQQRLEE